MPPVQLHVVLLRHTPEPEKLIAEAATLCYSSAKIDELATWSIAKQVQIALVLKQILDSIGKQFVVLCKEGKIKPPDDEVIARFYNLASNAQHAYVGALRSMQGGAGSQEQVQKALEALWVEVFKLAGEAISRGIKIKIKRIKDMEEAFALQRIKRIEDIIPLLLIDKILSMGHLSPVEHVSFTFGVEGISRACSHQLVRHRLASYSQQSQRYVGKQSEKTDGLFDFIIPPSVVAAGKKEWFIEKMQEIQKWYDELVKALDGKGEKAYEDARFVLPNAAETKIIITMNARELLHFFRVRCCERAQWEIRALATEMLRIVRKVAPNIFGKSGPACLLGGCTEGAFYCGKIEEVRKKYKRL